MNTAGGGCTEESMVGCAGSTPDRRIVKFIRRHHVLTLSTCHDSESWCANIFYAYIPERNLFVYTTDPKTRHGREGAQNPQVSASIVLETKVVGNIRGLQIAGRVRLTDNADEFARKAYLKRFPYAAATKLELWILEPAYMKFTDNTLGFSRKLLWKK